MRRYLALCTLIALIACGSSEPQPVDPNTLPPLTGREQAIMVGAESAARQGNPEAAERDYLSAIGASTGHVEAHIALAKLYAANHQPEKERAILERALVFQPNNPGVNYLLGKLELASGHYQLALYAFERGLVTVPGDLDLSTAEGIAHDMLGHHTTAQAIYLRTINLHKGENLAGIRTNLGMSYLFSNDPKRAIAQLKPLAEKPNASPVTRHNLALAYGLEGKPMQARLVLRGDIDEDTRVNELKRLKEYIGETGPEKAPPRLMKPLLHEAGTEYP